MKAKEDKAQKLTLAELAKAKGINPTSKRRVIFDILEKNPGHHNAESVYQLARKKDPSIGQATVYRTLRLMKEKDVISSHSFGQDFNQFESTIKKHHDHLVCDRCGKIEEFASEELEEMKEDIALKNGYKMLSHKLDIHGICPACQSKQPPAD